MVRGANPYALRLEQCLLTLWCVYSNKADLGLLEEMGITPDTSHHGKKHSLRVVGSMAIACIRMKRLSERWAGTKQLQESLARELEGVRRKRTVVR